MSFEPFKAGNHVEYLAAAVFQGEGYLVRRSVPLKVADSHQDVTDIDVLGIRLTKPFQLHRIICDCKDRQKSKPYERIFWGKGLACFVDAVETYVTLPRASWEVCNFARSGQVRVLTHQVLNEAFQRIYGKRGHAYGLANEAYYEPFYRRLAPEFRKDHRAASALFLSRMLFLADDPYVGLNIAIDQLQTTAAVLRHMDQASDPRSPIWKYIAADLTVAISLLVLGIASDTLGLSPKERERHTMDRLTYGDVSPHKAKEIFELAKELALHAANVDLPPDGRRPMESYDLGKIEAPDYARDVYGLVERAIQSPELYSDLPQLLDFLLFEQSLQDRGFSDEEYQRTFPIPFQQERLKVARNIFSFVRDACGLSMQVFWPREIDHLPKTNIASTPGNETHAKDSSGQDQSAGSAANTDSTGA